MKGNIAVISSYLRRWERPGVVRYYCTSCVRITPEEVRSYVEKTGKDPSDRRNGVKLYFDEAGELHVDGCDDPALREVLEARASKWYQGKERLFRARFLKRIHIYDHLERFSVEGPDGWFTISYKGLSYRCQKCDMDYIKRSGEVVYDELTRSYTIGPDDPELRAVLSKMIEDLDPEGTGVLPVPD